ncbi:MAG: hypothetical protein AB1646_00710 [Thermodesulfobacteriota bacterium]
MKRHKEAVITREKLTKYLLSPRRTGDKSKWLRSAGYTFENWQCLRSDLRELV